MADIRFATVQTRLARHRDGIERALSTLLAVLSTVIGLVILGWAVLYITKGRFLKEPFERIASRISGRTVDVRGDFQLYLNPINIRFRAEGMTITNPGWAIRPYFFTSRLVDTTVATVPLIFGTRRATWLQLLNGEFNFEWDEAGQRNSWTFGDPDQRGEPFEMPAIRRASIDRTLVAYRDPKLQLYAAIRFASVAAAGNRVQPRVDFTGDGTLRARPFVMKGALLSPNQVVAGGDNQLTLVADSGPTHLEVAGRLNGVTEIEGSNLRLLAKGPNLARLFDFLGVAVPDTRAYRFTSSLTKTGGEWRFTRLAGHFGDSDLAGRMTISLPRGRLFIDADLASRKVDIIDVGPFIGYDPERIARAGDRGIVRTVGGRPRLLPDATLRAEALRNFDAHVDYRVATIRAEKLPVANVGLTLDLDRNLLVLSPLNFDLAGGHLASDIRVNARGPRVVTDYDIRLSPTPMGRLLAGFGVEESGTSGTLKARIRMRGEGDTVHESLATSDGRMAFILPRGTFWTRNIQLSEIDIGTFIQKMFENKLKEPVEINCGLVGFTVRDGIAAADPILIDTRKNVILGRGGFSFRTEALDLALRADAKTFSLFSGQSPVGLGGYFAQPSLNVISPELLGRAGAGLGLAVAAAPLAAIIAFVDIGDAKAADCGPVLAGARAAAQRTDKGEPRRDVGSGQPSQKR